MNNPLLTAFQRHVTLRYNHGSFNKWKVKIRCARLQKKFSFFLLIDYHFTQAQRILINHIMKSLSNTNNKSNNIFILYNSKHY